MKNRSPLFIISMAILLSVGAMSYVFGQESGSGFQKYQDTPTTENITEKAADRRSLVLATGRDQIIDLKFVPDNNKARQLQIGNPTLVLPQVVQLPNNKFQIVFKALKAGETTVAVRDEEGKVRIIFDVRVDDTDLVQMRDQVQELLGDIEGIRIRIVGRRIVIDGELIVPNDAGRLQSVITQEPYSNFVTNLTILSDISLKVLSDRIQRDINQFASNVRTRVVNGQIWLEGSVDTPFQARRASRIARLYLPEVKPSNALDRDRTAKRLARNPIQNFIIVNPPPPKKKDKLLRITAHFVELRKDYNKFFGFKWQPGFTSDPQIQIGQDPTTGATGAAQSASFTATISSLFPKLQSAQDAGFARILKTGTVVVRSGVKADLTDKTQIPFVVVGPDGQVTSDSAGVGLQLVVTAQRLGDTEDIDMDVDMSQINVTGTTSRDEPITAEHRVITKLYVKSGESAAIAAVSSADVRTDFNKDDPDSTVFNSPSTSPLFSLLRSKSYSKTKNQYVIFITPQIIENASQGTEDLKRNFRVRAQ